MDIRQAPVEFGNSMSSGQCVNRRPNIGVIRVRYNPGNHMACFQGRILEVSGLPMNSVESLNSVRQFSPFFSSRLTNIGIRERPAKLGFSNFRAFACAFAPAGKRAICDLLNLLKNQSAEGFVHSIKWTIGFPASTVFSVRFHALPRWSKSWHRMCSPPEVVFSS